MKEKVIFLCENNIDGFLTAIYDGFALRNERYRDRYEDNIEIYPKDNFEYELFAEYIFVETDSEKAMKTAYAIEKKIGRNAWDMVMKALCHYDAERACACLGFLVRGFKMGGGITDMLGETCVMKVMEYSRKAGNEAHLFLEFLRFEEINHLLFAKIAPKCEVLPLLGDHFAERFPAEDFIIYDENRKQSFVHKRYGESFLVKGSGAEAPDLEMKSGDMPLALENIDYGHLWKTYVDAVMIEERKNAKCQRTHMPFWYRKNMTEFKK